MKTFTYKDSPMVITLPESGFIGQEFTITCKLAVGDDSYGWVVKVPETVTIIDKEEQTDRMTDRIKNLEHEIQICMDEGEFDIAAMLQVRIIRILEKRIIKDTVIDTAECTQYGTIKEQTK